MLQKIGRSPATIVDTVMNFGRRRRSAPSMTASRKCRMREHAELKLFSRNCLFEVDHHDNRGLHRRTEKCDEPDPDRDREVIVQQPEQIEPAG